MSSNDSALSPAQGGFRFLIELFALAGWAFVGANLTDSAVRWLLALGFPIIAAVVWGTVRVPNDLSASGSAPVPVPGLVRLFIEIDILGGAALLTALLWRPEYGIALGVAVLVHFAMTTRRVTWLLAQRGVPAEA